MTCRLAVWALLGGCLCAFAGEKPIPSGQVENKHVAIRATVYTDKEAIKQLLGSDLGGFYVVVQAEITPREALKIFRDDFMLRSDRDGEKAKPYTASEMLGSSVMVVSQTYGGGGGGVMNNPTPGGGVWGPPIFLPGAGSSIGNGSSEVSNDTTIKEDAGKKKDPMLAILESKIMPEKETEQPISGLLYFPMDPKQKPKQLELYYTTPSGRISLRFKQ